MCGGVSGGRPVRGLVVGITGRDEAGCWVGVWNWGDEEEEEEQGMVVGWVLGMRVGRGVLCWVVLLLRLRLRLRVRGGAVCEEGI